MGKVLLPPRIHTVKGRCAFLVGPIQGAADWQNQAAQIIHRQFDDGITILNPRRETKRRGDFTAKMYNQQVDWETHFLRHCAEHGVILAWLAKEADHQCDRAYAQTTRGELFEWKVRHERDGVKLALGIEPGFTGERYIRRRFAQDCPDIIIRSNLVQTCHDAALLANC